MRELDRTSVVISVVYDGPPRAGKTTSVRSLARGFGREVFTPEEREGRTVFFDWLEHLGGRFEGAPIRCQIVSVPGQKRWSKRAHHFVERADVVVFVGDTTIRAWPKTMVRLAELRAKLDARPGPPVGLVFQANKRDRHDAVPLAEIQAGVASARTAIVESIAHEGSGVREAFVFAVRLALDRVREESARGTDLGSRRGFGMLGPALIEDLRAFDEELVSEPDANAPVVESSTVISSGVRPPTQDAPSGFVWPPIEGRIMLREAAPPPDATVETTSEGDLVVRGDTWLVQSPACVVYRDLEAARAGLVAWAREHAVALPMLSRWRCVVLAESSDRNWRLWQFVKRERTLRDLAAPVDHPQLIHGMREACAKVSLTLECSPDTIGINDLQQPIYVGLMPPPQGKIHEHRRHD